MVLGNVEKKKIKNYLSNRARKQRAVTSCGAGVAWMETTLERLGSTPQP